MGRTCLFSLAGAGIGFVAGILIIQIAFVSGGRSNAPDATAVSVFVGVFLAGCGAISGAIVGAVGAIRTKQQAKEDPTRRESERDG
jgi:hypothetical protein